MKPLGGPDAARSLPQGIISGIQSLSGILAKVSCLGERPSRPGPGTGSVRRRRCRVVHALAYPGGDALGGLGGGELAGVVAGRGVEAR